jgi:L-iditol 2-dehydrogenase
MMQAAVYKGNSVVEVESIPVPEIGRGEVLIRVESCGICPTDLKKIAYNLLPGPRVFGHETAGVIVAVGEGVTKYKVGDRAIVFHHIPCGKCFYCGKKLYAQCPVYKKVGVTAGYEPAGGGFAQYVRVMDWIVERGIEVIPDDVSFDAASFVEPVNTCLKGMKQIDPQAGDVVAILGQGPVGLVFTMMAARLPVRIVATDTFETRRKLARKFGAHETFDPRDSAFERTLKEMTEGRGADVVIVAASASGIVEQAVAISRPGARILLFAQTSHQERIEVSGADICMGERVLCGSYSASVDVQKESADLVFSGALPVAELISHQYSLSEIHQGIERALHPDAESLKIIVQAQR